MFMRYTYFGVGHPVAQRRITRDCLGSDLVAPVNAMDVVREDDADQDEVDVNHEAYGDGEEEGDNEINDEELEDEELEDEELEDEELEDEEEPEDEKELEDEDEGEEEEGEEDEDPFDDHLSF
jgi:hypothetical protein